jgi:hypothetical protein
VRGDNSVREYAVGQPATTISAPIWLYQSPSVTYYNSTVPDPRADIHGVVAVNTPGSFVEIIDFQTGLPGGTQISGLTNPWGVATDQDNLWVSFQSGSVAEYNAANGAVLNPTFITGSVATLGVVYYNGFIYTLNNTTVGVYNATTGATVNSSLITGLGSVQGFAVDNAGIFIAEGGNVAKYALNGTTVSTTFLTGFGFATGVGLGGTGGLFVTDYSHGTVGLFDAATGATINSSLITGLTHPFAVSVLAIPEPATYGLAAGLGAMALAVYLRRARRVSSERLLQPAHK